MEAREIARDVFWIGAIDWDRRLFDSLIPLPDGTSYNAYLVKGSEKTVLIDTVDPRMRETLLTQLESVPRLDYIVSHHAEQDHSGSLPLVLEKYPDARIVTGKKGRELLMSLLKLSEEAFLIVEEGETLDLGGRTLEFIYTPWVHWPETMCTYLQEDEILFSCDFFGSHVATSDLYATDESRVYEAAKRYYAEIMMPFRKIIRKNLAKVRDRSIKLICPSHGPLYDRPELILAAYEDWAGDTPTNSAVVAYVTMHGSTEKMVEKLVEDLIGQNITVHQFNLPVTDIGKLAINLVDSATIVIGTPTVHVGPHPVAAQAVALTNLLRPKARFLSVIGSYGWSSQAVEQIAAAVPNLDAEILDPVVCKGLPRQEDYNSLGELATTIGAKHRELGVRR